MNNTPTSIRPQLAAAVAAVLLAACASTPSKPAGSAALRLRLDQLQADPQLAGRAPLAMEQAGRAVSAAEAPQSDAMINAHLQFMADRKISIAAAEAHNHWSLDQRKKITEDRATMQLNARTQEADAANQKAAIARQETAAAKVGTAIAMADASDQRQQADKARDATADAERNAADLRQQIVDMQGRVTDRGVVITLGDVLFASGTADLNSGGNDHLGKLAAFMIRYPDRNALIEGHTDSIGSDSYNQGLSQRRADSVKTFLAQQGVGTGRMTATGMGEGSPVGNNGTATGRQQNRRVEVIIGNSVASLQ
jgi:outer membrane protein OmpA-like peptidoglycan-associated protein